MGVCLPRAETWTMLQVQGNRQECEAAHMGVIIIICMTSSATPCLLCLPFSCSGSLATFSATPCRMGLHGSWQAPILRFPMGKNQKQRRQATASQSATSQARAVNLNWPFGAKREECCSSYSAPFASAAGLTRWGGRVGIQDLACRAAWRHSAAVGKPPLLMHS